MLPYVDTETGEVFPECPHCEQARREAEVQIVAMERELRSYRSRLTRAENALQAHEQSKRDGAVWKAALKHWQETFPDRRITSKSIQSQRATIYFQRLGAGASPEDVDLAVTAAREYPYVVYGRRRKSGAKSDMAIDIIDICKNDVMFDWLVSKGREMADDGLF